MQQDGTGAVGEWVEVSRQELFDDYVRCCRESCQENGSCRDNRLLDRAARYLLREPRLDDTFSVFPFYQVVIEGSRDRDGIHGRNLGAFVKATELLETLCVNLFVQPWKKEFRTIKTYTGPFVYWLLPVLGSSTIQSVLSFIGYQPHTDAPQSVYRLVEDANPEKAVLMGFELLLARVECYQLLELLKKNQPGPQQWLELLHRRAGITRQEESREKRTAAEHREEKKKEELRKKELPSYSETRNSVNPVPKPRRRPHVTPDESFVEMQRTYPDLAFRGRPLVTDPPQQASVSRSASSVAAYTGSEDDKDESKASELYKSNSFSGLRALPSTEGGKHPGSEVDGVMADYSRVGVRDDANARNGSNSNSSSSVGKGGELRGRQELSLHITLKAGAVQQDQDQDLKPGDTPQSTTEPAADVQDRSGDRPELSTMSSMEEELLKLSKSMDALHV